MAITVKHYTRVEAVVNGVTVALGSLTTPQEVSAAQNEVFDRTYAVANSTLTTLWSDADLSDFAFMAIVSDQDIELQLVTNEDGTVSGSDLENGFVVKLRKNHPFVLAYDDSRNLGDVTGTFNEANYRSEIDTWETNWTADVIDRIEGYQTSGQSANVRVLGFR